MYICNIYSDCGNSLYSVRMSSSRNRLSSSYPGNGYPLRQLYDNKQDCKDETHLFYDDWERLREIQRKERKQC